METETTTGRGTLRNFRDVGHGINTILAAHVCTPGIFFRSGAFQTCSQIHSLPLRSIINLRREPDPNCAHIATIQVAPSVSMNNYTVTSEVFHEWIQRLYETVAEANVWPMLVHCTAGKDRTGVAIALLFKNLGIPDDVILQEYASSQGTCYPASIQHVLEHMSRMESLRMSLRQKDGITRLFCVESRLF